MKVTESIIPLRQWIASEQQKKNFSVDVLLKNQSLLRTTTVAYGIVELLKRAKIVSSSDQLPSTSRTPSWENSFSVDNFLVRTSSPSNRHESPRAQEVSDRASWNNIRGLTMVSHSLNAHINEPSFLYDLLEEKVQDGMGMYLEVEVSSQLAEYHGTYYDTAALGKATGDSGSLDCQKLGLLLYELYSGSSPVFSSETKNQIIQSGIISGKDAHQQFQEGGEPAQKDADVVRYDKKKGKSYSTTLQRAYASLQESGFPSSICTLVQNLIDGSELYHSLEAASEDVHLLLCDPECYLFDQLGSMPPKLRIKEGKVFGREAEIQGLTDAFCRVSSGKSEALFIGGYSGSGKTVLVQSVTARVNIAGGYVLSRKIDQMSRDRPLLEVLAAFNDLCLLVREKHPAGEVASIASKLLLEFENDFSMLERLVPNIGGLCPSRESASREPGIDQVVMNSHSVNYVLQRFVRIISSKKNPIVLFLDDLQWAGSPALDLIYAILSDTRGSVIFFVGSYRDNEVVDADHPLFELMANLELSGIHVENVQLSGLDQHDLNLMISESLCMFPRISKPLSDIIFSKTLGNPFFALFFLSSLIDTRLLKYNLRERRWIWDQAKIRSECITDNVLYLLTKKMTSLPENVQLLLTTLSCFGIKADERIVSYLGMTTQYSGISVLLDRAISERCIQKQCTEFQFVHDKVREAAYSLIPDATKKQFHYDLGMLLYSVSEGQNLNNTLFQVIDQINYGIPALIQPGKQLDISKLNFKAGSIAMARSDFTTAHSYATNAVSLLPVGHWQRNYEFVLQLYFLIAKSAHAGLGSTDKATKYLSNIIQNGHNIDDKLDAYYYYITILHHSEKRLEAFNACREVLLQLNEEIEISHDPHVLFKEIQDTEALLDRVSDQDWYTMKEMDDTRAQSIVKFYELMTNICYQFKAELMPLITCKMIRVTLQHGISTESVVGLTMYAAIRCQMSISNVEGAHRIGKIALNLSKRFNSPGMIPKIHGNYYGFVAVYVEPIQSCVHMLGKACEVGMSTGGSGVALDCAIFIVRFGMLCSGKELNSLLKKTDYFIGLATQFDHNMSRTFLTIYREVISTLRDRPSASSQNDAKQIVEETINSSPAKMRAFYTNRMLLSFWQGYSQRCNHFVNKLLSLKLLGGHNQAYIKFYGALNLLQGLKNKNGIGARCETKLVAKAETFCKDAIKFLKSAQALSSWNYSNKIQLLEAELLSIKGRNSEATFRYKAAITSSWSSKFIHEEGFAAERAAIHYQTNGDKEDAINCFNQAKRCYEEWGSGMKVDFIEQKLSLLMS